MKSITKQELLVILKEIITKLEKEEIPYEIPLCHIDKNTFNYIDFIVPDNIDAVTFANILDLTIYKNEKDRIQFEYKDLRVNFIKSNLTELKPTYHYYSWNILYPILNIMLEKLNLSYTTHGLKYIFETKSIFINKNLQKIFDFMEISFKNIYGINIPTLNQIFNEIIKSSYFNYNLFTKKSFEKHDPMYKYNKDYYDKFLKYIKVMKNSELNFDFDSFDDSTKFENIHSFFPESKFLTRMYKIYAEKQIPTKILEKIMSNKQTLEEKFATTPNIGQLIKSKEKEIQDNKIKMKKPSLRDIKDIKEEGDNIFWED